MEARPKDRPDGYCGDCGDPVQKLPATGRLLNMDGTSHDATHVERLRQIGLTICDALDGFSSKGFIKKVEVDEERCDSFLVTTGDGIRYHFYCGRMTPPKRR